MARDEYALEQQAAAALHVQIIPGTEIMRDVENIHFTHAQGSEQVLLPHPSSDPKDPLNWSKKWKYIVIGVQFIYVFVTVESALSIAPMFPLLGAEFKLNDTEVSLITGTCVIALGYANFIIVPCSNIFGRRFTCIIFGLLTIGTSIWEALATSYSSLIGARVLNGVATATNESLMVQVVADMFFLHERGQWTGLYFTAYFLGLFIGPVIAGNIANIHGWRSFFWLSTGLAGFCLVLLVCLSPETKFHRDFSRSPDATIEKTEIESLNAEKNEIANVDPPQLELNQTATTALVGEGKPASSQFNFIQRPDPRWRELLFRDIFSPVRVFLYPIIFWAALSVAGPANLLLFWNLTESAVLSGPPYNWNPSQVGYSNFSFAVGGIIGLFTAGPFSDWVAQRATKRNDGIREAEMRLPALIPYAILTGIGTIIGGIAYQRSWDWEIICIIGYGFTGLSVTTIPTIAIAYAIDCYKPISGEIMVVATVVKNTCGFGMSYWVAPLAAREGYISPTMVEFALTIGPMFLAIPLYVWGKKLRQLTAKSNLHRLEEML